MASLVFSSTQLQSTILRHRKKVTKDSLLPSATIESIGSAEPMIPCPPRTICEHLARFEVKFGSKSELGTCFSQKRAFKKKGEYGVIHALTPL